MGWVRRQELTVHEDTVSVEIPARGFTRASITSAEMTLIGGEWHPSREGQPPNTVNL